MQGADNCDCLGAHEVAGTFHIPKVGQVMTRAGREKSVNQQEAGHAMAQRSRRTPVEQGALQAAAGRERTPGAADPAAGAAGVAAYICCSATPSASGRSRLLLGIQQGRRHLLGLCRCCVASRLHYIVMGPSCTLHCAPYVSGW